nr:hypothetical protein [Rhizobium ruizarguesonis]
MGNASEILPAAGRQIGKRRDHHGIHVPCAGAHLLRALQDRPPRPSEWDVITLFVQPLAEDLCDVWPWMALFDDETAMTDLIHFQQTIFLQDRSILENQIPRLLPLDPGMEIPTRADLTSIAYRRWLKRHNYTYGAQLVAQ